MVQIQLGAQHALGIDRRTPFDLFCNKCMSKDTKTTKINRTLYEHIIIGLIK